MLLSGNTTSTSTPLQCPQSADNKTLQENVAEKSVNAMKNQCRPTLYKRLIKLQETQFVGRTGRSAVSKPVTAAVSEAQTQNARARSQNWIKTPS